MRSAGQILTHTGHPEQRAPDRCDTLSRTFTEPLAEIDCLVEPYAARMRTADLEQCIATLSSQAELGIRLRLQPGVHPLVWNAIAHVEFTRIARAGQAGRR